MTKIYCKPYWSFCSYRLEWRHRCFCCVPLIRRLFEDWAGRHSKRSVTHRKFCTNHVSSIYTGTTDIQLNLSLPNHVNWISGLRVTSIGILSIPYEFALSWMPQNITDDYSTLVQVDYLSCVWSCSGSYHMLCQAERLVDIISSALGDWPLRDAALIRIYQFSNLYQFRYLEHFRWICRPVNGARPHWLLVNIGAGNSLVPPGSKCLSEPMLTQYFAAMCRH